MPAAKMKAMVHNPKTFEYCMKEWEKDYCDNIHDWVRSIINAEKEGDIERVHTAKTCMMYSMIDRLPIKTKTCIYCHTYDCGECPYGKTHDCMSLIEGQAQFKDWIFENYANKI